MLANGPCWYTFPPPRWPNFSPPLTLALSLSDDGERVLAYCHSNECAFEDIATALLSRCEVDIRKERAERTTAGMPRESRHVYRASDVREITQVRLDYPGPCGRDGCKLKRPHKHCHREPRGVDNSGFLLMPHGDPALLPVLCEGEKTAAAVSEIPGFTGWSYLGGTAGADKADYSPLSAAPLVLIAPDNDNPGKKAALVAAQMLQAAGVKETRTLPVSVLPQRRSADLADVSTDRRRELLEALRDGAMPPPAPGPSADDAAPYPPPGIIHSTDAYLCARTVHALGDRCVIAIRPNTPDGRTEATIYSVEDSGILNPGQPVTRAREKAARTYFKDAGELESKKAAIAALVHARLLREPATGLKICAAVQEALAAYPRAFEKAEIVSTEDLDADQSVFAFPNLVLDLRTLQPLSPPEARKRLCAVTLPDPYNPDAKSDLVDLVFPPWAAGETDPDVRAWQTTLGVTFSRRPRREFFAGIGAAGAGKTTRVEILGHSLKNYVSKIPGKAWEKSDWSSGSQSHNGDFVNAGRPFRLSYTEEVVRELDPAPLKELSGGSSTFRIRQVKERPYPMPVSAHILFIGNSSSKTDETVSFGLSGDDADSQSMRDRARLLPVIRIPEDQQDPRVIFLGDDHGDHGFSPAECQLHRQAVVNRIAEYCYQTLQMLAPLDGLASLDEWTEAQVRREMPLWRTDWLESALVYAPGETTHTGLIYDDYLSWHEGFGAGKPVSQGVIQGAVMDFLGLKVSPADRKDAPNPRGGVDRRGRQTRRKVYEIHEWVCATVRHENAKSTENLHEGSRDAPHSGKHDVVSHCRTQTDTGKQAEILCTECGLRPPMDGEPRCEECTAESEIREY